MVGGSPEEVVMSVRRQEWENCHAPLFWFLQEEMGGWDKVSRFGISWFE